MISLLNRETRSAVPQPRGGCPLGCNQRAAIAPAFVCVTTMLACTFASGVATPTLRSSRSTSSPSSAGTPSPSETAPLPGASSTSTSENGLIQVPFEYEFLTPFENLPQGEGLVMWDFKAQRFDYLTWDGRRFPMLSISLPPGLVDSTWPAPVFGQADEIVIPWAGEFYVFDLKGGKAWGYATDCDDLYIHLSSPENWAVGTKYVAFLCSYDVHVISLAEPASLVGKLTFGNQHDVVPTWRNDDELTIRSKAAETIEGEWCTATIPAQRLDCHDLPYWIGAMSPDGASVEVREVGPASSLPWEPDRVGVGAAECLERSTQECHPDWYDGDGLVPAWDDHSWTGDYLGHRLPAGWSPDGETIIFITQQETRSETNSVTSSGHDVWRLNLKTGSFTRLRTIPTGFPMFRWLERNGQYLPPLWAPDGEQVLIESDSFYRTQDSYPLYLLSARDGSLTTLTEQGGPVLGPLRVP